MYLRALNGVYRVLQWLKYPVQHRRLPDWAWAIRLIPRRVTRLEYRLVGEICRVHPYL